ncbi:MAG: hypothetical protein ACHQ9S_27530 [Candidatus Binatia bacterium]
MTTLSDNPSPSLARPRAILDAAARLFKEGQRDSALILIYALIDILGSLTRLDESGTAASGNFRSFVVKYLLPRSQLGCTADDLWGARCGILHELDSQSDHSRSGRARTIIHMGGLEQTDAGLRWEEAIERSLHAVPGMLKVPASSITVVHVNTLIAALSAALSRLALEITADASFKERIDRRVQEELVGLWVREST